jgi:hypothetical protein
MQPGSKATTFQPIVAKEHMTPTECEGRFIARFEIPLE